MTTDTPLKLSVLDLSPVPSGATSADALRNTLDLARFADALGFTRYWLAEHHNTNLLACSSPEILIGHVASVTSKIRVGSGGIMLPNHTPLKVAENFRMLEALHAGRIDLGIGRAPGTDGITARALRRSNAPIYNDDFPQQLAELLTFFKNEYPRIIAMPSDAGTPEIWLLGSSDFSAHLAAELGLGFAFAHHINPLPAIPALRYYQEKFRPSAYLAEPRAMLGVSAICAETDKAAEILASSADLVLLRFQQGNHSQPLPSVAEATAYPYTDFDREVIRMNRERLFVGSPETVGAELLQIADATGVNEIMITTLVHEHAARKRSYQLLAEEFAISFNEVSTTKAANVGR